MSKVRVVNTLHLTEDAREPDADYVLRFTAAEALAIQTALWAGFGLLFGELAERLLNPKPATAGRGRAVPAAH